MNLPKQEEQKLKIASPEKVSRLLEKAGQTGLPLLIRTISNPSVAVKGRAKSSLGPLNLHGFKVGNISDKGIEHLAKNAKGGVQLEFALSSMRVTFYSSISHFDRDDCTFTLPDFLLSIERRKNARFAVLGSQRAFISIPGWRPDATDPGLAPFFISSSELSALLPVADVSLGGLSISDKFPAICSLFGDVPLDKQIMLYLPMMKPLEVAVSIRWRRKTRDVVTELHGQSRLLNSYRYGVQFLRPSEELLNHMRGFIQMIAQAEAI